MKELNRWFYVVVGVVVLLFAGLIYAWSVMAKTIGASHPEWSAAQLSMTFTMIMAFFCIGGLVAGLISKKVKPCVNMRIGAVLFGLGFFVASSTGSSIATLYIGFGLMCGLGAGFAYNPVMSTVTSWFPDKQGLVSGILLMGFGLSAFIVGKVFAAVAPPVEGGEMWKTVFRTLGIVVFLVLLIASFFIVRPGTDYAPAASAKKKAIRHPAMDADFHTVSRIPSFWLFYIWTILVTAAGLALVSQASGIATQVGGDISPGTIATVVGLISIMNGIGRVIFGGTYDKTGYRVTMIADMAVFIIAGLMLLAAIKTSGFGLMVVGFMLGGAAYGGIPCTISALISDFYGQKHFPVNFSVANTNLLVASFASTIAGKLYDSTGSYLSTGLMMIGLTAAGFVAFLGIRRPKEG